MFSDTETHLIGACVSNYIELLVSQRSEVSVGMPNAAALMEFYDKHLNDCFALQEKINALMWAPEKPLIIQQHGSIIHSA